MNTGVPDGEGGPGPGGTSPSHDGGQVQLLKLQYQALSERDSSTSGSLTAIGALGAAGATLWLSLSQDLLRNEPWIHLLLPLVPLLFLSYLVHFGIQSMVQGKLFRQTERLLSDGSARDVEGLSPAVPALARVLASQEARPARFFGGMVLQIAYFLAIIILYAFTIYTLVLASGTKLTLSPWLSLFFWAVFGVIVVIQGAVIVAPDRFWEFAVGQTRRHANVGKNKLVRLLLPRPAQIGKCATMAAAWGISTILTGWSIDAFLRLVWFIVLFELIYYQARYIMNDLRGLEEDRLHPAEGVRARLSPTQVRPAVASLLIRLALFVVLLVVPAFITVLTPADRIWLAASAALVTVVAVGYDQLRERTSAPLSRRQVRLLTAVLCLLVWAGMFVRAALGLWAGTNRPVETAQLVSLAGAGALLAVGLALLSMGLSSISWTLESVVLGRGDAQFAAPGILAGKPHVWYFGALAGVWSLPRSPRIPVADSQGFGEPPRFLLTSLSGVGADLAEARVLSTGSPLNASRLRSAWYSFGLLALLAVIGGLSLLRASDGVTVWAFVWSVMMLTVRSAWYMRSADDSPFWRVLRVLNRRWVFHSLVLLGLLPAVVFLPLPAETLVALITSGFIVISLFEALECNYRESADGLKKLVMDACLGMRRLARAGLAVFIGQTATELTFGDSRQSRD